jgi:hypothetical protein
MSLIQQAHGGQNYDARFGHRMRGQGPYVRLLDQRVKLRARQRGLLDEASTSTLNRAAFRPPGQQAELPL